MDAGGRGRGAGMANRNAKGHRPRPAEVEDAAREVSTPIGEDEVSEYVELTEAEQAEVDSWAQADAQSERWLDQVFHREAGRRGEPWPPVAPATPEEAADDEAHARDVHELIARLVYGAISPAEYARASRVLAARARRKPR
jgi:hypothetical protein